MLQVLHPSDIDVRMTEKHIYFVHIIANEVRIGVTNGMVYSVPCEFFYGEREIPDFNQTAITDGGKTITIGDMAYDVTTFSAVFEGEEIKRL